MAQSRLQAYFAHPIKPRPLWAIILLALIGCSSNSAEVKISSAKSQGTDPAAPAETASTQSTDFAYKTLTLNPSTTGIQQLDIVIPAHTAVSVNESDTSEVSATFNFVGESNQALSTLQEQALAEVEHDGKLRLKLLDNSACSGIVVINSKVQMVQGKCLKDVVVDLPKNQTINIYKVSENTGPELIWQGQIPETSEELVSVLKLISDDNQQLSLLKRFSNSNPNVDVTVQDLESIAETIFSSSSRLKAITLLAAQVRRTQGSVSEQDLEPLLTEFSNYEQEEIMDLFLSS